MGNRFKQEKYEDYKKFIEGLNGEYRKTFEKIELYINGSSKLNYQEKNNCLVQVLDTLLSGQNQGKLVDEIIGLDLKKYCDGMIYGESIYIHKLSRICFILLGALFYIVYMQIFNRLYDAFKLKEVSVIFKPLSFGVADIVLMIAYICIPMLISIVTKNYFENPKRCKKVKRYTYYLVWLFTILMYSTIRDVNKSYLVGMSFSKVSLVLIYLVIINLVIFFLMTALEDSYRREEKYLDRMNKQYETHVEKSKRKDKTPLDFDRFKRKKLVTNILTLIMFSVYCVILLVLAILIGECMLDDGQIETLGIIILIIISFLEIVIIVVIRDFISINKKLVFKD